MALTDEKSASFIIRVWREGGQSSGEKAEWRGSIEQIETGEKSYFCELGKIPKFMKPFIEAIGISTPESFWEVITDSDMNILTEEELQADAGKYSQLDKPNLNKSSQK
ncbi:hypothetical protein [Aliikangiella sp. G2MR2-5]|uniref:hypothetical protein n=1 Tax=Aliikangiella sp. G2MR2-5 TaxID=2788943 RepID=UPI0018AA5646|nr:hypothetical protein [Aliikangiella sp. G2MR2-5]